ncbi:MAG: polysaccharide biosynthesis tyrosine autokinase, partial [Phycisphaerae bacterium]|nr:polysaccharide biosynthesis tyrosine autokinase [Phycisphaerae bacterium]
DIWRIIRRRMWVIVITSAILIVLGIGINIAWLLWWPSWPGVATLEVESPMIPEALAERRQAAAQLLEMAARQEANRIRSRRYAQLVLQNEDVRKTDWYKKHEATDLADFEEELSVRPIRETAQFRVSFHTRNPEDAPLIVRVLTQLYLADRQSTAQTELEQRLFGLQERERNLVAQLDTRNREIDRFVTAQKLPLKQQQTVLETQLAFWAKSYSDTEVLQSSIMIAVKNMEGQIPASWIPDQRSQMRIDGDPTVRTLRAYLLQLKEGREAQSKRLGHDHPHIKQLDERIRISQRDLLNKLAELKQQFFVEAVNGLQQAASGNETTLEQISGKIEELQAKKDALIPNIIAYENMLVSKTRLEELLNKVQNMISNTRATLEQTRGIRTRQVKLVSPAIRSPKRSSPKLKMNLIATVFLSLMAGVGLAFLLEFLDKSVRSSQDVRRHTNLSLLGSIPALEEDEANPEDMYSVVTHAPRSLLAEAFRQIRTNIMFSCRMEKCRSMLVTSAAPDDGRTCIAVNLAASIALSGKKVLLIDANFRKPALKRLFPNLPDEGFAQLLTGRASIERTIAQSDTPGLWVMDNGQTPTHHSQLLGSSTLGTVIEQLSNQFDQVILDGPPALLSADALTLSGQVAGIIFVARAGKTSRGELNRMREEISRLNSHIHGVVLNAVEAVGGGYLRERYRLFYDYQESLAEVGARTEVRSEEKGSEGERPEES